ncbi:MAG: (Sterile alpha motif) protein [Tardiphaga sp.]|jgi:class 3 adenylate cyclase/predicted ATPase|nr:(Sterile alpha motif) protein [Tardiphaga sp.]
MDVGTWLRRLGLEQYEASFRENEIEVDVLPELTEQHFKDLGVSLGHRLKMLRAIRELSGEAPSKVQPAAPAESKAYDVAERRQLTVMFCDLVGSTALAAQFDPEDMGDLIRAFQNVVAAAVARFDGHIARLMGDGVLVYFGYPRAHEDDAERAARAGLGIVEAVGQLRRQRGVELEVRIGISTGLVVVGELMGEGEARERGVVGETPNLAARLQALAEPGSIVVSESTRRLLGRAFELRPLGLQELRGFKAPVPAWSVVRETENVSRFEAHSEAMTPFVGREHEVALLLDRWRIATEGDGQVALLSGEAGIGKSRILAALRERIGDERHTVLRYQCSPHHVNDAFYPIVGHIWHCAGFTSGEPAAARLDKLETMIARAGLDIGEIAPYLASLLSIPTEGRYAVPEMAPSEVKERTIAALTALLVGLTQEAPLLALFEDAHWVDPTSFDLLNRIVERVQNLRVLIVVTFRPEFMAPWVGRAHVTALALNRFGRNHAVAMIDRIASGKALPAEVLDQIVAKTDGVPLFVEELTKSVLESGLLREEHAAYVLAATLTPLAIPSTLHDSLTARLDRLSPIKEIAQIGATIGREFSYQLLEAVAPIRGPALQEALRQLVDAELIYGRGAPPQASYIFKHALVQDTAYGSLLRSRRQRIHADIAQALMQRLTDEGGAPAIIAHHFTEAGLAEQAASHWLAAAELALSQSAATEAEHHASAGLALIPQVPEGPDRDAVNLGLLVARANALVPLKSNSAPETFAALSAAKQLLDAGVGTDLQRVSILFGLCSATTLTARLKQALDLAHEIIEVAERQDDPTYLLVGHRMLGTIQLYAGQNREALQSLRRAEKYRDPSRQRALSYRFGWDPGLAVLCFEVLVRLSLGLLDSAARLSAEVQTELLSHGHATTVASATFCAGTWPLLVLGDLDGLERESAALAVYCAEKRIEQIRLLAGMHHAYARAMREPAEKNIAALRATLVALRKSGGNAGNSIIIANLAEALLMAGDLAGAEAALDDAFAFVEQSGERYWLADLHRLRGQIALKQPQPDRKRAEDCFVKAIEIASSQEGRLLHLRAAFDLALLWRDTGANNDPRALLEPILATIEGGETTRDVRNARSLLAELV